MYNINVTCGEIETEYRLHADLLNYTNNPDCDQSWYSQGKRLLADPSDPQTLFDPAISVSSDHLFTSHCVDKVHHEIICHSAELRYETIFRVFNGTDSISRPRQTPESHQLWWISALIFIVLLVLICFFLRKRISKYLIVFVFREQLQAYFSAMIQKTERLWTLHLAKWRNRGDTRERDYRFKRRDKKWVKQLEQTKDPEATISPPTVMTSPLPPTSTPGFPLTNNPSMQVEDDTLQGFTISPSTLPTNRIVVWEHQGVLYQQIQNRDDNYKVQLIVPKILAQQMVQHFHLRTAETS
ncbi:hypothetical protein cypCar_00015593 [Cyprinus carpio]|nr:hypothetical protein cypCar_00015593 [Cyprinus carpio]